MRETEIKQEGNGTWTVIDNVERVAHINLMDKQEAQDKQKKLLQTYKLNKLKL